MLISKKPIFFPAIDKYYRLSLTEEDFNFYCLKYRARTSEYDIFKMSLKALKDICRSEVHYNTMLLLIGMDTQAIIASRQYIAYGEHFDYDKQTSLGIEKPVIFPGFDNWDRVINEFGFREETLNEICNAYTKAIEGKDYRKMNLAEQLFILKPLCQGRYFFDVMLVNIGMDTQNMIFCGGHIHGKKNAF